MISDQYTQKDLVFLRLCKYRDPLRKSMVYHETEGLSRA
jgi:hypothetical protein